MYIKSLHPQPVRLIASAKVRTIKHINGDFFGFVQAWEKPYFPNVLTPNSTFDP